MVIRTGEYTRLIELIRFVFFSCDVFQSNSKGFLGEIFNGMSASGFIFQENIGYVYTLQF
jgi:hypothetical protein